LQQAGSQRLVVPHIYDLVAHTLGGTRDAAHVANGRGVPAARLSAIMTDITENLGRSDLKISLIAARHHVTPRYVRMLFEKESLTFSEFVLGERLARAHRALVDPRGDNRPISDIAFANGFADLSYFNRTFRRRYAASPSEVREAARRGWN
jgi:AraC-like DNA-binding protein